MRWRLPCGGVYGDARWQRWRCFDRPRVWASARRGERREYTERHTPQSRGSRRRCRDAQVKYLIRRAAPMRNLEVEAIGVRVSCPTHHEAAPGHAARVWVICSPLRSVASPGQATHTVRSAATLSRIVRTRRHAREEIMRTSTKGEAYRSRAAIPTPPGWRASTRPTCLCPGWSTPTAPGSHRQLGAAAAAVAVVPAAAPIASLRKDRQRPSFHAVERLVRLTSYRFFDLPHQLPSRSLRQTPGIERFPPRHAPASEKFDLNISL